MKTWKKQADLWALAGVSVLSFLPGSSIFASSDSDKRLPARHRQLRADVQTYLPEKQGECGLRKIQKVTYLTEYENRFNSPGVSRNAMNAVLFEADSMTCLKRYGVVQFIKGCVFASEVDPLSGKIIREFSRTRESMGDSAPFIHQEWEPDTQDADPLYFSSEEGDRLRDYWFPKPGVLASPDERNPWKYKKVLDYFENYSTLAQGDPARPMLLVRDIPSTADFSWGSATNVSLFFKSCLYDLDQVPLTGSPALPGTPREQGGPIHCFDWSHNHIYNHELGVFEETQEVDPYCYSEDANQTLAEWKSRKAKKTPSEN